MSLAVIYQSTDLSTVNKVGLVICLAGIILHSVRKAMEPEVRKQGYDR